VHHAASVAWTVAGAQRFSPPPIQACSKSARSTLRDVILDLFFDSIDMNHDSGTREFLASEAVLARDPGAGAERRRMLQVFFALGQPETLPGSSYRIGEAEPRLRVFVVTPYYKEPIDVLRRCVVSVRKQTYPCTHVLVADGFPRDEIDGWDVVHVRNTINYGNFGDTPRAIGGAHAIREGCEAVAYLDADNWWRPRHIESLVARHRETGAPVCHAMRTFHRLDGSLMPLSTSHDNVGLVDTNCLFLTGKALAIVDEWGNWPKPLSFIGDRLIFAAIRAKKLEHRCTGAITVCYEASQRFYYRRIAEEPPPAARADADIDAVLAFYRSLPAEDRMNLDSRFNGSVEALLVG
jgi:hypothetical protein